MSYSNRLYAKEYAGGDRTFEVSYTGTGTRTPYTVYTNAFHGFYNGFEGVYTNSRTSTLAWQTNFAGAYTASYEGFVNYNSDDTDTYSKAYTSLKNFAGQLGYRKDYSATGNQPDNIWSTMNILANYSGTYSTDIAYSRVVGYVGDGNYDGAAYTATWVGELAYTPTYSGFVGFASYTKTYDI